MSMSAIIKAPALKPGAEIGIVAPGSPVDSREILAVVEATLRYRGYETGWGETTRPMAGYLAGNDLTRRTDLERMWLDDSIGAIWCLRGGYGSIRLLARLQFKLLADRPKLLIGFSDITALEFGLWARLNLVTFHGPVLTALPESEFTANQAFGILSGRLSGILDWPETVERLYVPIQPGKVRGRILGGNLATICSLIGTGFCPVLDGVILFLEETGEAAYRIDRMLTQLILTGIADGVAAVMVGRCIPIPGQCEQDLIRVFVERLAELSCPAGYGFPIGHGKEQWTIPQGVMAEVDTRLGVLVLVEGAVV